jgi:hypothetical protein
MNPEEVVRLTEQVLCDLGDKLWNSLVDEKTVEELQLSRPIDREGDLRADSFVGLSPHISEPAGHAHRE